ncbi:hypothetical protein PGT21_023976 [Puccinia graminis f. sp. tritici]|uniref:Uncharacterized protein n=2 Tax=Puccinia graminis f. sp. tritici TaxID=56615 RepID=A0A5B0M6U2_PUCGR|nr:hypothetical protein PGTUg99_021317 [Puccinia graminis f. sp. tritici]KAA1071959.1 hypothetical protein PGT21_023976 [Puccinia graminis f. sp. tritici]
MCWSSKPFVLYLLAIFPLFTLIHPSCSASHLERRRHKHRHSGPPLDFLYIMIQPVDYTNGPLKIYTADGTIAYQFSKVHLDSDQGLSTSELQTGSSQTVFELVSLNDFCAVKTTFEEPKSPRSKHRRVEIYPRGMLKDKWRFSYIDDAGVRQNFKFNRGFANKGGQIYAQVNGHDGDLIAELKNERRKDSWLTKGSEKVSVYTLSCAENSPREQLIAFMALVFTRVSHCGL